jgi:hypothetical protein
MRNVAKFILLPLIILVVVAILIQMASPAAPSQSLIITTPESPVANWIETDAQGVKLGINVPPGWHGRKTDAGILIAQRPNKPNTSGMQAHMFVRSMTEFQLPVPSQTNEAWSVLKQVADNKRYTGGALVSEPYGFDWGGHDAAYYLLNDGDQHVMLVMAMMTQTLDQLITFNISSSWGDGDTIRDFLPDYLSACSINGQQVDSSAVEHLPDPLMFPVADQQMVKTPQ